MVEAPPARMMSGASVVIREQAVGGDDERAYA
jgi:hypothetical protein